jgi:hypothetical protein
VCSEAERLKKSNPFCRFDLRSPLRPAAARKGLFLSPTQGFLRHPGLLSPVPQNRRHSFNAVTGRNVFLVWERSSENFPKRRTNRNKPGQTNGSPRFSQPGSFIPPKWALGNLAVTVTKDCLLPLSLLCIAPKPGLHSGHLPTFVPGRLKGSLNAHSNRSRKNVGAATADHYARPYRS